LSPPQDVDAHRVFERIFAEWKAQLHEERYINIPFVIPLMVLVTRIFSSVVIYSSASAIDDFCKTLSGKLKKGRGQEAEGRRSNRMGIQTPTD
jgi:hypothetical protein